MKKLKIAIILEERNIGGPQIYAMKLAEKIKDSTEPVLILPQNISQEYLNQCKIFLFPPYKLFVFYTKCHCN